MVELIPHVNVLKKRIEEGNKRIIYINVVGKSGDKIAFKIKVYTLYGGDLGNLTVNTLESYSGILVNITDVGNEGKKLTYAIRKNRKNCVDKFESLG